MLLPDLLHHLAGQTIRCSCILLALALSSYERPGFHRPPASLPDNLVLTGPERKAALEQLQASAGNCLKLNLDESSGEVTCQRVDKPGSRRHLPLTEQAKRLKAVLDDHTVIVRLSASDSMVTSTDRVSFGGSYLGNAFTGDKAYAPGDAFTLVPIVMANQQVDPATDGKISEFYKKPGADMLHEVTEAYAAAQYAQRDNIPDTTGRLYYEYAHSKATPQSGTIYARLLDSLRKETTDPGKVFFVDYFVKADKDGPEKIIRTLYKSKTMAPLPDLHYLVHQ